MLSTKKACKILKMGRITLINFAKAKKTPAFKIGRMWKFEKLTLEKWIQNKSEDMQEKTDNQTQLDQV